MTPSNDKGVKSSYAGDGTSAPEANTRSPKGKEADGASSIVCAFCKATSELTYICKKKGGLPPTVPLIATLPTGPDTNFPATWEDQSTPRII